MQNKTVRGPEAAGFVVLGATLGAVLASVMHVGLLAAWCGGTAGAVLLPLAARLNWARLTRQASGRRVSSPV